MRVEVRATGLREMRRKHGLTQRQLAQGLSVSPNYIPALEGGARHAGPRLQEEMVAYFGCQFADLFEVILIDLDTKEEKVLQPRRTDRGHGDPVSSPR